jgi:hypothetical protein
MQHRVKHPPSAVEHIRPEAPPPAKDPNAERLEYPEETLTPEERKTNILEIDETAGMAAEIDEISKKVAMDTAPNDSHDGDSEAEPMDVEDDAVYAKRYDDDMEVSGPVFRTKKSRSRWRTPTGNSWERQQTLRRIEKISCGTRLKHMYEKAKRSDYVRKCRTGVQHRRREWKKAKQKRENRKMPHTPPPRAQEEGVPRSRLTQVWWLEN